jgi:hypothetical protein
MSQYVSTQYPGVRYREHKDRKYNGRPDRYFFIRYKRAGKLVEEAVGWASNGMNGAKATKLRAEITQNIREGSGPQSLEEKREIEQAKQEHRRQQKIQEAKDQFNFGQLASEYQKWARENKASWKDDEYRYNKHLKPALAHLPLKDITPFAIERLKSTLQKKEIVYNKTRKKLSPATIKHCLVLIRQMFSARFLNNDSTQPSITLHSPGRF